MAQNVLSVSQLNEYIRSRMDADTLLTAVAVRGEISNYKLYPSGHHYFTLKDESGALKCVMFKSSAVRLRFRPSNGMKVIAMGRVTVYPRDGAYQLYCAAMAIDGVGDLYAAFEQLKAKLAAQGIFDEARKKPLPKYPGVIGIVTSPAGAAVHDMLRILRKRYPLTRVRLFPARVQGAEAAGEIAAAIRYANRYSLADVLIVGRGGGSIEDLWPFNEEIVARAIYDSEIPVISAVGHEPDVTISDYAADLRAATPSNAAELVVPDQDALRQTLDSMASTMRTMLLRQLNGARQRYDILRASPALKSPEGYFIQRRKTLELLESRLHAVQTRTLNLSRRRFVELTAKLDAMSPLKVLTRGYAVVYDESGELVRSVERLQAGMRVRVKVSGGKFTATVLDKEESANAKRNI